MFLDIRTHDYDKDIIPFIKNGIIIDTSVILKLVDGVISTRISKKKPEESGDYKYLLDFLDLIKLSNRWDKFFITPHILTEVCTHLRNDYNKNHNYKEIVEEIVPIIDSMGEKAVCKDRIIKLIEFKNPIIEIGDISIFIATEDLTNNSAKIAILADDARINDRYKDDSQVMIMDYRSAVINSY